MNLEYGSNIVKLTQIGELQNIRITYRGNFFIQKPNRAFRFIRKGSVLELRSLKIIEDEILFKYSGNIHITSCSIDRKPIKVIANNIDTWGKLKASWDDMTLEWDDYNMDLSINTDRKRIREKEFNKNELQQLFKT